MSLKSQMIDVTRYVGKFVCPTGMFVGTLHDSSESFRSLMPIRWKLGFTWSATLFDNIHAKIDTFGEIPLRMQRTDGYNDNIEK